MKTFAIYYLFVLIIILVISSFVTIEGWDRRGMAFNYMMLLGMVVSAICLALYIKVIVKQNKK